MANSSARNRLGGPVATAVGEQHHRRSDEGDAEDFTWQYPQFSYCLGDIDLSLRDKDIATILNQLPLAWYLF